MTPWYDDGLAFECARCSACCRHEPGFVFLSAGDLRSLARALSLESRAFIAKYCRVVDLGTHAALSLRETKAYDCALWGESGCSVYASRPVQCRTYPFWERVVADRRAWTEEADSCPGIGRGAPRPAEEIGRKLAERRADPALVLPRGTRLEDLDDDTLLGR